MKTVDIFCGCGGLSLGFEKSGYDILEAYDSWNAAVNIYSRNFDHNVIEMDCNDISIDHLKSLNLDVIIGGPPCQDYSSAGKRDENLGRATLTETYARIICEVKPKWFVMENVDRIMKSETLVKCLDLFKSVDYGLTQVVLNASLYGVPQKRKRYFLIGELGGEDNFLLESLTKKANSNPMSVRDYLGDELGTEYFYRHPRSYQRRGVFSIDEPSPTIRGVNRPIPPNYQFHDGDVCKNRDEIKPLTSYERARIQTFPPEFVWHGRKTELEQIIGNAVPVQLAQSVAECLLNYINNQ